MNTQPTAPEGETTLTPGDRLVLALDPQPIHVVFVRPLGQCLDFSRHNGCDPWWAVVEDAKGNTYYCPYSQLRAAQ